MERIPFFFQCLTSVMFWTELASFFFLFLHYKVPNLKNTSSNRHFFPLLPFHFTHSRLYLPVYAPCTNIVTFFFFRFPSLFFFFFGI